MKKQIRARIALGLLYVGGVCGASINFYPPYGNPKNGSGSYASGHGKIVFTNNVSNVLQAINQSSEPQQWGINYAKGGSGTGTYDVAIIAQLGVLGSVLNTDDSIAIAGTGSSTCIVAVFYANGSLNSNLVFNKDAAPYVGQAPSSLTKQEFNELVADGSGGYYTAGRVRFGGTNYGIVMHVINTGWLEADTTFGNTGAGAYSLTGFTDDGFTGIGRQSTGSLVVAGVKTGGEVYLTRLLSTGVVDTSYTIYNTAIANMQRVDQLVVDSQDRVLIIGYGGANVGIIARFNANGGLDTTFNGTGYVTFAADAAKGLTTLSDNSVIGVGTLVTTIDKFLVVKYTSAGVLDTTFGTAGVVTQKMLAGSTAEVAYRVTVTPLGQIAVAGTVTPNGLNNQTGVLLLDAYGAPVPIFFNVGYTVQAINLASLYAKTVGCFYQTMTGTVNSTGLAIMGFGDGKAENIYFANPS